MNINQKKYTYLCAVAHYTGGKLVISTEFRVLERPMTAKDVGEITADWQRDGYQQPTLVSFSLLDSSRN